MHKFSINTFQGLQVTQASLDEVTEVSGVLTVGEDYLLPAFRAECERIIPDIDGVKPCDAADIFILESTLPVL